MSTTPKSYYGINLEGVDWHGPMVEIIDECVDRRVQWYHSKKGYVTEAEHEEAYEWGDKVAVRFAKELHPHLVGKV